MRSQLSFRTCAAALLLLFVVSWLSVPVTLAPPQLHGCTMECCEEEGFCCCIEVRRQALAVQTQGDELPQINELTKQCAVDCATTPSSISVSSLVRTLQAIRLISLAQTQTPNYQSRIEYQEYLRLKDSSPRAPPRLA